MKSIVVRISLITEYKFLFLAILFLYTPIQFALADTYYEDKIFSQDTVLRTTNQPYYFSGSNTVPRGITVTVERGTNIFIDGNIKVLGRLILAGEKDSHITIRQNNLTNSLSSQNPITLIGGSLMAEYTHFLETRGVVDAFATSSVFLDAVHVEGVREASGSSILNIFNNSTLTIKNSTFKDIQSQYGIEVFNQSFLDIKNTTFTKVGIDSTLYIYGNGTTATIAESQFYGVDKPIYPSMYEYSSPQINSLKTKIALQIFNGSYADISVTDFEDFETEAISALSNARLTISKTTFTKNNIGVKSFNSNIDISDSDIFENLEQGAVLYGGTVHAINNWWGSDTGPKSIQLNPNGRGDVYVGTANINPWKLLKQKKPKCCSSILLIPGHQGSRIYKKGILTENQLWEPNTTSDITKLSLNSDGQSIDKTLYTKDIIDKTNIVYGGNNDIEIYKGLMQSLNGLNSNYSIEDWQYAAYDWRMSPNTIVTEGSRYGPSLNQYQRMEDQIVSMAYISKTKKVTLLAHSYGGLVTKRLLAYLLQRGKISLIDKVIFVAVPEIGSPSSLFALLHGDNQDIGNGYIVNASAMRVFAQNMPSVYALLPKVDRKLIYGIQATNTISVGVPNVSTVSSMYQFLFKDVLRPSTIDTFEVNVPLVANKKIKEKIEFESGPTFIKPQSEQAYSNIEFYNILGVGLNTPESITYNKKSCINVGFHSYVIPSVMSPNCGLTHTQNFSHIGDGVVLAEDVFTGNTSPFQNIRWGEKYIFNIAEYNRKNNKNYSHANIVSSPPITSTLMQIVMGTIGDYALPMYMTKHGGRRMGGQEILATSTGSVLNSIQDLGQYKRYQISVSDAVFISGKDSVGNIVGINFPPVSPIKAAERQIIPTKNASPNSSVSYAGSAYHIHMESIPATLNLRPAMASQESSFNLTIQEIVSNINFNQEQTSSTTLSVIASFQDIPITEYSNIIVNTSSAGTSTIFQMDVVDVYDDIFTATSSYIVNTSISPNAVLSNQGSQELISSQNNVGASSVDVVYLINLIKTEIQNSRVRTNFRQRYILKLNSIEKNYKSLQESKMRLARIVAKDTTASLALIVKDLSRSRALNYTGGIKRAEAFFLYTQFSRLSRAFGD